MAPFRGMVNGCEQVNYTGFSCMTISNGLTILLVGSLIIKKAVPGEERLILKI